MEKKVILITGTNSGFGWLTAKSCAALGYTVYATMRGINGKNAAKAKELSAVKNIHVIELEITDANSVSKAVKDIIAKEGRLDVLVNNAGYNAVGVTETFTEQDLDKMLDVHVKGPWRTIRAALPQMRKQGEGLIINFSSALGRFATPFMTVYSSAKFAIDGLTEGLHFEVRPLGVDVVMIQPGAFPTEINSKTAIGSDASSLPEYGELADVPRKMGEGLGQMFDALKPNPQSVADAVLKLIATPKGKRPLRTVVDPATGALVETANQQVKEQYKNFLTAFGMSEMMN